MEKFEQFEQNYKTFTGYLSADSEIQYFDSGKVKTSFALPLKKSKDSETVWLNCETWNDRIAEKAANELKKGSEVTVIGYFKTETYKEKEYIKFNVKGIF
jgi:single-stranded DNA-binding protein